MDIFGGAVHENYLGSNPEHPDKIMNALNMQIHSIQNCIKVNGISCLIFVLYAMKIPQIYTGNTLLEPDTIRPGEYVDKIREPENA